MFKFLTKLLDSNEKQIQRLNGIVAEINAREKDIKKLKDKDFRKKTEEFKNAIKDGKSLDQLLPEAYALVREAAFRTINERPYDVQLMAAIVLHEGKVAEQKTGEGKTLSASLPLYLNALTGRGTHLVTVNDYLARVGAGWTGPIFHLLGVSVSSTFHDASFLYDPEYEDKNATDWRLKHLKPITRKEAYQADITYGINSEFGFDYLRDNMVSDISQVVQREYHYAIVDEVDSVLIDEARTPHIISAPDIEPTQKYFEMAKIVERLSHETDFLIDEKLRTAHLTDAGIEKVEKMLGIPNLYEKDFHTVHLLEAALKAKTLFKRERDYIVRDNQVIIVDEFTGRLLPGRRYSEGLHQAIEAKEGVPIQQESKTLATVSLQNYFRMYEKLAGMTGTAATEAEEFHKIYNLEVVVIPTHRPMIRKDYPDIVYKTARAKYQAVAEEVAQAHKKGQPVLVGTTSIENNEIVSELLHQKGVPHQVLNAKNHEKEALIISQAGEKGAVTVATNMAGRGVDIILGGAMPPKETPDYIKKFNEWQIKHDEVVKLGGLYVVGTERHESRRIDNQLRGRAGRQGDPGSSRFFVSLEDDIMRLFGGDQVAKIMTIFKLPENTPLEHGMVSKAIEQAQIKVEGFHFDTRKHLVEYDDVLNKQREIIYKRRKGILTGDNLKEKYLEILYNQVDKFVNMLSNEKGDTDYQKIIQEFVSIVPFDKNSQINLVKQIEQQESTDDIRNFLKTLLTDLYNQREKQFTPAVMRQVERWVMLTTIDNLWMDHLTAIDDLREGIGLRGYGQRDPLVEYKNEAFSMFERLVTQIDYEVSHKIFRAQVQLSPDEQQRLQLENQRLLDSLKQATEVKPVAPQPPPKTDTQADKALSAPSSSDALLSSLIKKDSKLIQAAQNQIEQRTHQGAVKKNKVGRNDPCWCGSGKKWKKCHYPQQG